MEAVVSVAIAGDGESQGSQHCSWHLQGVTLQSPFLNMINQDTKGRENLWYAQVPSWQGLCPCPTTHTSHPTSNAALGTPILVPFDTVTPRAPYLPMLQQILPAALRIGLCVGKCRLMTGLLHKKRNVWSHWFAIHSDSLADSPDLYPLLIQAPCVKRTRSSELLSCARIVYMCLEAKWNCLKACTQAGLSQLPSSDTE